MIVRPNGTDLFEVMAAMDQVKSSPLVDAERTKNHMGDAAAGAEDSFCLVEEFVETGKMFA